MNQISTLCLPSSPHTRRQPAAAALSHFRVQKKKKKKNKVTAPILCLAFRSLRVAAAVKPPKLL